MAVEVGEKDPAFTLLSNGWKNKVSLDEDFDKEATEDYGAGHEDGCREGVIRARRVEYSTRNQAVLEDLNKAL